MKFINKIAVGLTLIGAVTFSSCSEDYLETAPSDQVSDVLIASSLDNLYLALNGLLSEFVSQETGYQCFGGLPGFNVGLETAGDDMTWKSSTWYKTTLHSWDSFTSENSGYNYKYWQIFYQWILNANKILECLEVVNITDQTLYDQVKGEALAIRGFAHFYLVQLYGPRYDASSSNSADGIIYRTSSAATEQARESVATVYDMVIADLDAACALLEPISGLAVSHISSKVAYGFRARVAMAQQDYANAAVYAAKAISIAESDGLALMEGNELYCGFADITSDTDEAMHADITVDEETVYYYSFYAYMSWNYNSSAIRGGVKCINADTYDTMSETDLRRAWFDPTGEAEVPSTSYAKTAYQNRKFEARSTGSAVGDFAFMRLAEMYLTLAEAYVRSGNDASAQSTFTAFQVTRDPSYVALGNSGDTLAEEIMNSRRIELWGEGFRFFDLKRLDLDLQRGRNFDVAFSSFLYKDRASVATEWTWQIPDVETNYNTLCTINYY
ncbi:MAG: RagB/SusD family nutrient uptake outer membrane protein [Rikenellaceae bacterium]